MDMRSTILQRVEQLERQNRRLCWLLFLIPAIALFVGAGAKDDVKTKEVITEKLTLKDAEGKDRAVLMMLNGAPVLFLSDSEGNNRVTLAAGDDGVGKNKHGPGLFLVNGQAKGIASLSYSTRTVQLWVCRHRRASRLSRLDSIEKLKAALFF